MVQLRMDEAMTALIEPIKERAEVLDDRGTLLGYFIPAESPEERLRRKAFAEYDPERARRRRESPEGGFTTEQVLEHLKSLDLS